MIHITNEAFAKMQEKFTRAFMANRELLLRVLSGKGTENSEFLQVMEEIFPISDPLVLRAHELVTDSFGRPFCDNVELLNGSRCLLHMWYGALKEERAISGQDVPSLNEQLMQDELPDYFVPPGTSKNLDIPIDETAAYGYLTNLIGMMTARIPDGDTIQGLFLYPIIVITRLLNRAACPTAQ